MPLVVKVGRLIPLQGDLESVVFMCSAVPLPNPRRGSPMPMLIPGSERVVVQQVSTDGPLIFTYPSPRALIEGCFIRVRPPAVPIVDLTGGRLR